MIIELKVEMMKNHYTEKILWLGHHCVYHLKCTKCDVVHKSWIGIETVVVCVTLDICLYGRIPIWGVNCIKCTRSALLSIFSGQLWCECSWLCSAMTARKKKSQKLNICSYVIFRKKLNNAHFHVFRIFCYNSCSK